MKENYISQEELNKLNIKNDVSINTDVLNLIILIRNELNIVEKESKKYDENQLIQIKKTLNKTLNKIINIRK